MFSYPVAFAFVRSHFWALCFDNLIFYDVLDVHFVRIFYYLKDFQSVEACKNILHIHDGNYCRELAYQSMPTERRHIGVRMHQVDKNNHSVALPFRGKVLSQAAAVSPQWPAQYGKAWERSVIPCNTPIV